MMELTLFVVFCTIFSVPVTSVSIQIRSQDLLEDEDGIFVCKVEESKPEVSFQWIIAYQNGSLQEIQQNSSISRTTKGKTNSTLTLKLNREYKKIMCKARIENMPWTNSGYQLLDIKYAPEGNPRIILSQSGICAGRKIEIKCEWKGGYPEANVKLSCLSEIKDGQSSVSIKKTVAQEMNRFCVCYGMHIAKYSTMGKTVNVYYPPNKVTINQTSFLEGQTASLICEASGGNPAVYNYSWSPNYFRPSKTIDIHLTQTINRDIFTCYVHHKCKGDNPVSSTIKLYVEYYPIINMSDNMTVIENQTNEFSCLAEGNPKPTITWKIRNQIFMSKLLQVSFTRYNVSEVQCIATVNSSKHGILKSSKSISIFVTYPPVITIHHNVTNFQQKAQINCTAHANPNNIQYRMVQKWGTIIKKDIPKNHVTIQNVSYQDMGTWLCLASNDIPKKNYYSENSTEIKLNVAAHFKGDKKKMVEYKSTIHLKICYYCYPEATRVRWYRPKYPMPIYVQSLIPAEDGLFPFLGRCSIVKMYVNRKITQTYILEVTNQVGQRKFELTVDSETGVLIIVSAVLGSKVLVVILVFGIVGIVFGVANRKTKPKKKCKNETKSAEENELVAVSPYDTIKDSDLDPGHELVAVSPYDTIKDSDLDPGRTTENEVSYDDVKNTSINQKQKDANQPQYVKLIGNSPAKGKEDANQPQYEKLIDNPSVKGHEDANQAQYVKLIGNPPAKGKENGTQPQYIEIIGCPPVKGKEDANQPQYKKLTGNPPAKGHLDYENLES